jgi:phosphatidylinositol-3-phosphatase
MKLRRPFLLLLSALSLCVVTAPLTAGAQSLDATRLALPAIRHVFVVNLENKGYDETFGDGSLAPYLSQTLRSQGALLTQYYGIGHNSLTNYIAQISGQAPNVETQADCQVYTDFVRVATLPPGQAVGQGCVYPADVPTLAGQLEQSGYTWAGYMEDMGNSPTQPATCRHPAIGSIDDTQMARVGDQYAARHNPFVYFHSIIDSPSCDRNVVPLDRLTRDLAKVSTTPNVSFITPNLCNDGHDANCVDGRIGGLVAADQWLATWIPTIINSPAFKRDGLLIVTFDESEANDASGCCGEGPDYNTPLPGITGMGGGRTGAIALSRFIGANTWSTTPYNHYSLLCSIEQLFDLPALGHAGSPGVSCFGTDVYNRRV